LRSAYLAAVCAIGLAGCVQPGHVVAGPRTCDAEELGNFVGRPATPGLGKRMLRRSGAELFRWVRPGTVVTMDFRPDRLTVEVDGADRVTAARCG
jgi:hypothetical protein